MMSGMRSIIRKPGKLEHIKIGRFRPRPELHLLLAVVSGVTLSLGLTESVPAADQLPAGQKLPARVEFNRDIRPILSDKCFTCHGPDEKAREAELRLDLREQAIADRGGSAAIVPRKAGASEVVNRVNSRDPDVQMPPPAVKKPLTAREKQLLSAWIDQGAEYQQHWAFLPIANVEPPADSSAKHPLDRFIRSRLQQQKLPPSPPADPHTLIKRMSLDLTGLLPKPTAVAEFAKSYEQDSDAAVHKLARSLLDSPHYGERWGRHWLDQARYADSHGYTIDGDRAMWPYRDWVIRAINDDMPFDQFTIEQLAGDLLTNPTKSQLVATGFHRNTLINQEGGTDNEQFRNEEVVDRTNTTSAVWLGLTFGCAQCHNHKFDAISQREYYELFAFFNHTADVNNVGPTVPVREGELLLHTADPETLAELQSAEAELKTVLAKTSARQVAWEQSLLNRTNAQTVAVWSTLVPTKFQSAGNAKFTRLQDDSLLASNAGRKDIYTVNWQAEDGRANTSALAAVRLRVLPDKSLPKQGPGTASNGNFVLTRVELQIDGRTVQVARAQADHAQPGFPIAQTIDNTPDTGWAINVGKGSRPGAKMNAAHEAHFVLTDVVASGWKTVTVTLRHEKNDNYNIGRFAIDTSPTPPAEVHKEALLAAVKTPKPKRTAEQTSLLTTEFQTADVTRRAAEQHVQAVREQLGLGGTAAAMVMQELKKPRETYIHIRGDFLRKDKDTGLLQPDVAAVLPALRMTSAEETSARPTRLDLANWLVRDDHPLTARVTVNRVWMRYFGRGLVETENDFGTQGSVPTHPQLLDWLARRFIESGWSMKQLHELIVTSDTYRQSSQHRADIAAVDPLNKLLARQNRLRVDAEIVRDLGLSASGLLSPQIGGPSVRPPQPPGVFSFTQRAKSWNEATGPNRFRRGMYTQFYRSAPYPLMTTFDAPDFQTVCTRRPRSNTPLQSLTMANDAALFEMNQALAVRLLTEVPGNAAAATRTRIARAFLLCFCRQPDAEELDVVIKFQQRQAKHFATNAKAAAQVAPGNAPAAIPASVAASWTAVARALMNTDEFITRE